LKPKDYHRQKQANRKNRRGEHEKSRKVVRQLQSTKPLAAGELSVTQQPRINDENDRHKNQSKHTLADGESRISPVHFTGFQKDLFGTTRKSLELFPGS